MVKTLGHTIFYLTAFAAAAFADVRINEFSAVNSGLPVLDEDGDSSDWIEIYNAGATSVDLAGYSLTDDAAAPTKWTFPSRTLSPGQYLLVFASDKINRPPASTELHATFKLSGGGEYLALRDASGTVLTEFSPQYPALAEDVSYGFPAPSGAVGMLATPTPGALNSGLAAGTVADTSFSVKRGIYTAPVSVAITTETAGATIRYTTNGATPTPTSGVIYSGPLNISSTTTVRAIAYQDGLTPTNVDTHTYLFPTDIVTQNSNGGAPPGWPAPTTAAGTQAFDYGMDPDVTNQFTPTQMTNALTAIPSVMISVDQSSLTSRTAGIYRNPEERGRLWERAANVEILDATPGAFQVSARCGLRIRGGFSRNLDNPKHAFRLFFREDYGDSKLRYPLFGSEGAEEFDKFDLRTAQNYSWAWKGNRFDNTFLRDVLSRDLQGNSGQPYTRSRYYHLYLNGIYWGLYQTQERAEADFGATYFGGSDDEYDTLKSAGRTEGYITEATDGTLTGDWQLLWALARNFNLNGNNATYLRMQGLDPSGVRDPTFPVLLDVDNLIDYTLIVAYMGAYDSGISEFIGASNNWFGVRNFVDDDRGFAFFLHDAEHSMGVGNWAANDDRINTTRAFDQRGNFNRSNPYFLHRDIAERSADYRLRFADRAHAALFNGGYLDTPQVMATLAKRRAVVDQVIIAESARWGDARLSPPASRNDWLGAVGRLESTISTRKPDVLNHLRTGGLYPNTDAPEFSPNGGQVAIGSRATLSAPNGTIYYTLDDSDPRLPNGSISPNAIQVTSAGTTSTLIAEASGTWSYLDNGANLGSSAIVAGHPSYATNWKNPSFNDRSWETGSGIFGHNGLGVTGNLATINTLLGEGNGVTKPITSYLRRSFNVTDASLVTSLSGRLLADDGAIVYLNGVEIYRDNMPAGAVDATSFAANPVGGAAERNYVQFTAAASALVSGVNVIAIEVHQATAGSSDLGCDLELTATLGGGQSTPPITGPMWLNARALNGGEWSALNRNYYTTGSAPLLGDLVISEVHYDPLDASGAEEAVSTRAGDYEFIEIANISDKNIELRGLRLDQQLIVDELEGVTFEFTGGVLLPGGKVVVVADTAAFSTRYPGVPQASIAGRYSGGLNNGGEWIQLLAPDGSVLSSFRYDDDSPWPAGAGGQGGSLQLLSLDAGGDPADPATWFASFANGSPADSASSFIGTPTADGDSDGISSLEEYFAGSSDSAQGGGTTPVVSIVQAVNGQQPRVTITRDPDALGVTYVIEESETLSSSSWGAPVGGVTVIERVALDGGLVRETYAVGQPRQSQGQLFVRVRVTQQ